MGTPKKGRPDMGCPLKWPLTEKYVKIIKSKADTTHKDSVQPVSCAKGKRQNKLSNQRLTQHIKIVYSQCLAQKARGKTNYKIKG